MSDAVIAGTITFPAFLGGPSVSPVLGAPVISPSSSAGPTLSYNEGGANTMKVSSGAPVAVPFGTVASADVFYIGTDQPVQLILNGGAEIISLKAGGFALLYNAGITSATVEATGSDAELSTIILGD